MKELEAAEMERDKLKGELEVTAEEMNRLEAKNQELKQQCDEKSRQVLEKKKKYDALKKELEDTKSQAASDLVAKSEQVITLTTEH